MPGVAPALLMRGSIQTRTESADADPARVGQVAVLGVDERFRPVGIGGPAIDWNGKRKEAVLGDRVARRLGVKAGDRVEIDVEQVSNVPRSSLLGRRSADDVTKTLRLTVAAVLPPESPANDFSLVPSPSAAFNVFVPLAVLQEGIGQPGRANALLATEGTPGGLNTAFHNLLTLDDWGITLQVPPKRKAYVSVESRQLVLDNGTVTAVQEAAKDLGLRTRSAPRCISPTGSPAAKSASRTRSWPA